MRTSTAAVCEHGRKLICSVKRVRHLVRGFHHLRACFARRGRFNMEGASACLTSACKPTFARNALPLAKWVLALCFFKPGEAELHYRSVHSAFASLQGTQLSAGAMYAVRVSGSSVDEALSAQASQLAEQLIAEQAGSSRSAAPDADLSEVSFSAGNPRVEHLTGTVHLYRQVLSREEADHAGPGSLPVRPRRPVEPLPGRAPAGRRDRGDARRAAGGPLRAPVRARAAGRRGRRGLLRVRGRLPAARARDASGAPRGRPLAVPGAAAL
jgi:hypothetical protein